MAIAARSRGALAALGFIAVYLACVLLATRHYFLDDAFIGFQYLKNLRAGAGFTFDPALPRVEGVTNIGWLLFLSPFTTLVASHLAGKWLGAVLLVLSLGIVYRMFRPVLSEQTRGLAWIALAVTVSNFDFVYFFSERDGDRPVGDPPARRGGPRSSRCRITVVAAARSLCLPGIIRRRP